MLLEKILLLLAALGSELRALCLLVLLELLHQPQKEDF
jgi:hypothetical protein